MDAIIVDKVCKSFKVYYDKSPSLKEKILFSNRNRYDLRSVLKDVSFSISKGEAVGLIGVNGCGKSTLLKILSKIMYPTKGNVTVNGRISSLIELGAGFHPDMTGRENIFTNASIFGLSKNEIHKRLQSIIDFSELGKYIDNPIRTYSSGMYMRLAFAVAINVDAEILLIDEILAVGDAAFQSKCFEKLKTIKKSGTTIVIVSHSLGQIEQLCDRAIWIDQGRIAADGNPFDVHPQYLDYIGRHDRGLTLDIAHGELSDEECTAEDKQKEDLVHLREEDASINDHQCADIKPKIENRYGNQALTFTKVTILDKNDIETKSFLTGDKVKIRAYYSRNINGIVPVFGISINDINNKVYYGTNTHIDRYVYNTIEDEGVLEFTIKSLPLFTGEYHIDIAMHDEFGIPYDYWKKCIDFNVFSTLSDAGLMRIEHSWSLK